MTVLHESNPPDVARPWGRRALTAVTRRPAGLLAVLPVLFVLGAFVVPVMVMFRLSVTEFVGDATAPFGNYAWFFGDPTQLAILKRTVVVSLWVTIMCLALGFPYAYLMTLVGPRWRLAMLAVVMLPFWSNLIVRTYAWVILLKDSGPIQDGLRRFGVDDVTLIGNMKGVTIGATQVLLPFLVLPLYATLSRIDLRLLDAAESLGARPRTAFVKVYLPLAMPGILAGTSIVFILSLGFYFTPALLGSPRDSLISQQIVTQVTRLLAFGRGGAMALILLVVALVVLTLVNVATRRKQQALGIGGSA